MRARNAGRTCPCCDRPAYKKGFCNRHFIRWQKYGDPNYAKVPTRDDPGRITHCLECGEKLGPRKRAFCSRKCNHRRSEREKNRARRPVKKCRLCEGPIARDRKGAKVYCSRRCLERAMYRRKKSKVPPAEWAAKLREQRERRGRKGRDKEAERMRKWRAEHPDEAREKARASMRKWREANPEQAAERSRQGHKTRQRKNLEIAHGLFSLAVGSLVVEGATGLPPDGRVEARAGRPTCPDSL